MRRKLLGIPPPLESGRVQRPGVASDHGWRGQAEMGTWGCELLFDDMYRFVAGWGPVPCDVLLEQPVQGAVESK